MKIAFLGTPEFAVPSLRRLHAAGHSILLAVTRPDRPSGRGRILRPSPVKLEAEKLEIPLLQPERLVPEAEEALRRSAPEAIVVVAYGLILPPQILVLPPRGCINLHASLLPLFRGASPVIHAILARERRTGVTTLLMDQGIDTGPILLQRQVEIGPEETAGELEERLSLLGAHLLAETLDRWSRSEIVERPQEIDRETYAPRMTPEMGRIDWRLEAERVAAMVRALNPRPGAFSWVRGKQVKFWRASASQATDAAGSPGTVLPTLDPPRVICGGRTSLEIRELQFEGRRRMTGSEAIRGRWFGPEDHFESLPSIS